MIALFAICVAIAPAAQAKGKFVAGGYPATLAGGSTNSLVISIGSGTGSTTCNPPSYSGSLSASSETIQLIPSVSGCAQGSMPVTVLANGCSFAWGITGLDSGTSSIACPAGKSLEVRRYQSQLKQEQGEPLCVYGLGNQGPVSGVTYSNSGSGTSAAVGVAMNITIKATVLSGAKASCGGNVGETLGGSLTGSTNITATNAEAKAVGFSALTTDVYMTGASSGEPAQQPRVQSNWGSEALALSGGQDAAKPHELSFGSGVRVVKCSSVLFQSTVTGSTTELPVSAEYTGCSANPGAIPATIDMNSCHYDVHVLNAGPPYAGSLDVACTEAGDGIEANVYSSQANYEAGVALCTYKIAAQSGLKTVGLATAYGSLRGVNVSLGLSGMAVTVLKGSKIVCGASGSNLAYSGSSTLFGV